MGKITKKGMNQGKVQPKQRWPVETNHLGSSGGEEEEGAGGGGEGNVRRGLGFYSHTLTGGGVITSPPHVLQAEPRRPQEEWGSRGPAEEREREGEKEGEDMDGRKMAHHGILSLSIDAQSDGWFFLFDDVVNLPTLLAALLY
jgi:hypothetical protein